MAWIFKTNLIAFCGVVFAALPPRYHGKRIRRLVTGQLKCHDAICGVQGVRMKSIFWANQTNPSATTATRFGRVIHWWSLALACGFLALALWDFARWANESLHYQSTSIEARGLTKEEELEFLSVKEKKLVATQEARLIEALRRADQAGNTADAQRIADTIKQMRASTTMATEAPDNNGLPTGFVLDTAEDSEPWKSDPIVAERLPTSAPKAEPPLLSIFWILAAAFSALLGRSIRYILANE